MNRPPVSAIIVVIAGLLLTSLHAVSAATNNPLETVSAVSTDSRSPGINSSQSSEGVPSLNAIHDGDWAVYKHFDFDSGVASFRMHYASEEAGTVDVRLDSVTGPLLGTCSFAKTGGLDRWSDADCKVDNSQATVRDVYLIFHGPAGRSLLSLSRFVFLKSVVEPTTQSVVDLSGRVDAVDDEPQATKAWGMPETGFHDSFEDGHASHWTVQDMTVTTDTAGQHLLTHIGAGMGVAFTPNVYINKTDTGGEWRTLAEAALSANVRVDSSNGRVGLGFISKDSSQSVYVVLNPATDTLDAYRQLRGSSPTLIATHPHASSDPDRQARAAANAIPRTWHLHAGETYQLKVDWSPYSNCLIAFLSDQKGTVLTSFRTVIDLPAARRPMLIGWGNAQFSEVRFDPALDSWNYRWEWRKSPVMTPDVCNPAVWAGRDGTFYMMWRQFGGDTFHGVASSADGIAWNRLDDRTIKVRGDMNAVADPFGDGLLYITPGGDQMPWWTSDGSKDFTVWKHSDKTVGSIHGNSRIQEIIDTQRYPQLAPIDFQGATYRFIAFVEDWGRLPKPHTNVMLSNTLTDWTVADDKPLLPPGDYFWGEKGSAIGAAIPLPDGNILVSSCSCTNAGYTGSPEPTNISLIVDGKQPWHVLRVATLPDAPVSREHVWYEGPNFGTALIYDPKTDTLFFYGGFHDYNIGVMRVRHFLHPQ